MNLFGIGLLELAFIFIIAFLVVGPGKAIEMAKTAGRLIGDMKSTVNDLTVAADLSQQAPSRTPSKSTAPPAQPVSPSPPANAVPTTGPGEADEQQP